MHIAEGFLPVAHCIAWGALSAPFVVHGARRVIREAREHPESKLLLAAAGAFTFVVSAIKLPSVTGSSSHATGTGLGTTLFGPPVMAFLGTVVLLFQALLLGHGGLTTLGANVFSMAIAGPWAGYGAYRLVSVLRGSGLVAVFCCFMVADLATYVTSSAQLALAYPDPVSGFVGALGKFAAVFAVTQVPIAVGEGFLGVLIVRFLRDVARPELLRLGVLQEPTHA